MFTKGLIFVLLVVSANCRYVLVEDALDSEHLRVRRDTATVGVDNKGNVGVGLKTPVAGNDRNTLSQTASASWNADRKLTSYGVGAALDNVNGHGLSISAKEIPDYGKQVSAAGHLNLAHTDNHNLAANAFVSHTMPKNQPNYNTVGGGLDYMYKDKIGASLGAAHMPAFDKTDVSALGRLNLYRDPSSSFDFNAGAQRSFSPFIPNSRWEPTFGFTFSRSF